MKRESKKRKSKHITVKDSGVAVRIYCRTRIKAGRKYKQFDVAEWRDGVRRFITFADLSRARAKAKEIASRAAPVEFGILKLAGEARLEYETAQNAVQRIGARLDLAAIEYADARQRLGNVSLTEAVSAYLQRNPTTLPEKTVAEVVTDLIAAKRADKKSDVYLKDLDFRLGKVSENFNCQISSITTDGLNLFLRGLKCAGRSRNNYRLAIRTLFKFAESVGYLHKGHSDFDKVPKATEASAEIEIFTPKEMVALLQAAQHDPDNLKAGFNKRYATGPGLLPLLVLGGFAGLRTAEVERQRWEDILIERGFIRVTAAKGNTAAKRLVPISPNLQAWLARFRQERGPVLSIARSADAIARLADRAGLEWKHNALRHSFISYRVAETQNVAQVSLEAGNSPKMIHRHYRELVAPAEATEWFSISPEVPSNVSRLPQVAKAKPLSRKAG